MLSFLHALTGLEKSPLPLKSGLELLHSHCGFGFKISTRAQTETVKGHTSFALSSTLLFCGGESGVRLKLVSFTY